MKNTFKVGDKVVPHSKTVGTSFDDSFEINKMRQKHQKFLYVTKSRFWSESDNRILDYQCSADRGDYTGDFFNVYDLIPYVKPARYPEYFVCKQAGGFADGTAFIRQDSKNTGFCVSKYGIEYPFTRAGRNLYREYKVVTKKEAKKLLVKKDEFITLTLKFTGEEAKAFKKLVGSITGVSKMRSRMDAIYDELRMLGISEQDHSNEYFTGNITAVPDKK